MDKLFELQNIFAEALMSHDATDIVKVLQTDNFIIYQHSIHFNHTKALQETYPCILKIVGQEFFNTATYFYKRDYPATDSNFNFYGKEFNNFLSTYIPAKELPYLSELAMLEWHHHLAHYSADPSDINLPTVSEALTCDKEFMLQLRPDCQALAFRCTVLDLWKSCLSKNDVDQIHINFEPEYLLLYRTGYSIVIEKLTVANFNFFKSLSNTGCIYTAYDTAIQFDNNFDLTSFLKDCLIKKILQLKIQ